MAKNLGIKLVGASLIAGSVAVHDFATSATAGPATKAPERVCEFDKEQKTLVIKDVNSGHISGALFEATSVKDKVVVGAGGLYPVPGTIGIETGVKFSADFAKRACEVKHAKDTFGFDAITAPMVSNLKSYSFEVK